MKTDQIAINSISTRHPDLEAALSAYAGAGFRLVEFHLPLVKTWLALGHSVSDVKALLDHHQLKCIGGFEAGVTCFASQPERQKNFQLHIENAQLVGELGGGTIVVGTDGDERNDLDTLRAIGRTLASLAEELHPDVGLAVEFNWSPVVKSLRSAKIVVDEADHERVGILFDPAHFHCTPSKLDDLTADVVAKIAHVHVDDMADKPGDRSDCNADRVLPGKGVLDLKAILGRIEAHGYGGAFSIEMFNDALWKLPADDAAQQMYAAMKRLCE